MRPEVIRFPNTMPAQASLLNIGNVPYHWHDSLEMLWVLEGSVSLSAGDEMLALLQGDIAVVNPNEIHRIVTDRDNAVLTVYIEPGYYRKTVPGGYSFIYCCSTYHEKVAPEKYRTVKEHLTALIFEILNGQDASDGLLRKPDKSAVLHSKMDHLIRVMLLYLEKNFQFLRWGFGTTPFDERRVERLRQIARQATSDDDITLRLKALAAEVGVKLQYLSNDIKDKFGRTFQDLLYYGKCEHAARMLLGTEKRIVDISFECGFSDPKYLIKHFKRVFGCTPSEFRKRHAKNARAVAEETQIKLLALSDVRKYLTPTT